MTECTQCKTSLQIWKLDTSRSKKVFFHRYWAWLQKDGSAHHTSLPFLEKIWSLKSTSPFQLSSVLKWALYGSINSRILQRLPFYTTRLHISQPTNNPFILFHKASSVLQCSEKYTQYRHCCNVFYYFYDWHIKGISQEDSPDRIFCKSGVHFSFIIQKDVQP